MLSYVKKRSGELVQFDPHKLRTSILHAMKDISHKDESQKVLTHILNKISTHKMIFSTSDLRDLVEDSLLELNLKEVAKSYATFKKFNLELKEYLKTPSGNISHNALIVLSQRYLKRNKSGKIIETPDPLFHRVANHVSSAEHKNLQKKYSEEFYQMLSSLDFLPNTPCLSNAGTLNQLAACFVLDIPDSLEEIYNSLTKSALIFQSGGGVGYSFSNIRPKNSIITSTGRTASGPVSFMHLFDKSCDVIKQGGIRRGANMGILNIDHPDIFEFISEKSHGSLQNFNLSVSVTDSFMHSVINDSNFKVGNNKIKSRELFDYICTNAWQSGDPGLIFIDEINRKHPLHKLGKIEATNPCVTGDTLVYTSQGIYPIKYLAKTQFAYVLERDGEFHLAEFFITGKKDVFELRTKEGYSLKLTKDHRVLTKDGWKEAKDLNKDDLICINQVKGGFGDFGSLTQGKVLGWIIGDGYLESNKKEACLDFYGIEKQELAPEFLDAINEEFYNGNNTLCLRTSKSNNRLRIGSRVIFKYLSGLGITSIEKHKVPLLVFAGNEEFQKGFLQALFTADGSIQGNLKKGISIRLAQSEIRLLEDVQKLLLNFGIASKIYQNRRIEQKKFMPDGHGGKKEYLIKAQHELIISKQNIHLFAKEIGFLISYKQNALNRLLANMKREPNKESFLIHFKSLTFKGKEDVYDCIEPLSHSFVANGIKIHNCGEVPLLDNEACVLGSINLSHMVRNKHIDWPRLQKTIELGVRFLDNVVTINKYPTKEIEAMCHANRKIGLGVMGWADMLLELGIKYDSEEALDQAKELMSFIKKHAELTSEKLAKEKGAFPNFNKSNLKKKRRNATLLSIAPTGSISLIANCSSSIEPLFAISYVRKAFGGIDLFETNKIFENFARYNGFYSKELMIKISQAGSIQSFKEIPKNVKDLFVTALDIPLEWHIKMQAVFQSYVDNAVSKTINLPNDTTIGDIKRAYMLAWKSKCKGITIYRYGSKDSQVLNIQEQTFVPHDFSGGCFNKECNY